MPRPYYQRNSPAPRPETPPDGPTTDTLVAQADALTRLARGTWITTILGCLYVWITIAALKDIQFFLPSETLTLPILNTGISPGGFFVFAPALLLAVYVYLHLILTRLWRVYRDLGGAQGKIDGLPVADRVSPWMLNHILRQKGRPFDWLGYVTAIFFGWAFALLTIFALSYRYLRAHVWEMTLYHSAVTALAIVAAFAFWLFKCRLLVREAPPWDRAAAVAASICLWPILFVYAQVLIAAGDIYPGAPIFLTTRAQLFRAELSQKPAGWNAPRMNELDQRIALLEDCRQSPDTEACKALNDEPSQREKNLKDLRTEHANLLASVTPAQLGHVDASANEVKFESNDFCETAALIDAAADLRGADLRGAFLPGGNLLCANLDGADLRQAELSAADLRWARMEGADLREARMEGANLIGARMEGANLTSARMGG